MARVIEFESVYNDAVPGEYGSVTEPSPYFHLQTPEESAARLLKADEVVIPGRSSVRVIFDYPLENTQVVKFSADTPAGFTRRGLVLAIAKHYQKMYQEEAETTTKPVGLIPGMLNRAPTNGKYGIWGHGLGDLELSSITCDSNGLCELNIDS